MARGSSQLTPTSQDDMPTFTKPDENRAEPAPGAGQHHNAGRTGGNPVKGGEERRQHGIGQGVQPLGAMQGQGGGAAVDDRQDVVSHGPGAPFPARRGWLRALRPNRHRTFRQPGKGGRRGQPVATVDGYDGAVHILAAIRRQENHQVAQFVHLAVAAQRHGARLRGTYRRPGNRVQLFPSVFGGEGAGSTAFSRIPFGPHSAASDMVMGLPPAERDAATVAHFCPIGRAFRKLETAGVPVAIAILDCLLRGVPDAMDAGIAAEIGIFARLVQRIEPSNMIAAMFLGRVDFDRHARKGALPPDLAGFLADVRGALGVAISVNHELALAAAHFARFDLTGTLPPADVQMAAEVATRPAPWTGAPQSGLEREALRLVAMMALAAVPWLDCIAPRGLAVPNTTAWPSTLRRCSVLRHNGG